MRFKITQPIIVAIISATGAIIAAVIGLASKFIPADSLSSKLFNNIDRDRRAALKGKWAGVAHQEEGMSIDYQIIGELKATSRRVRGEATLSYTYKQREYVESVEVDGGFIHDRFLKMEYQVKNKPGLIRFGFLLLEYSSDGQILQGRFLSYGADTKAIVWGSVELHKAD